MDGNVQKAAGRPVVYLETSFVSYLTGRVSGNPQRTIVRAGYDAPVITTPSLMLESRHEN